MVNKELIEKLIEKQNVIIKAVDKLEKEDVLPTEVTKAKDNVMKWEAEAEGLDGDHDPHEWEVAQFSHALKDNIELFDRETRQQIREYEELAGKLHYNFDRSL